jgi:hypothetical protein
MDRLRKECLQRAIREHLAEQGARNWKLVTGRFPEVGHATFWRIVKAVRAEGGRPEQVASVGSQKEMDFACFFPPCCEPMKKLAEYQSLVRDAEDLVAQSKGAGGEIKNWKMHARGVALRETLLRRQVEVMEDLHNSDIMASFYKAIMDALVAADSAVRDEVMKKLEEINARGSAAVHHAAREAKAEMDKL